MQNFKSIKLGIATGLALNAFFAVGAQAHRLPAHAPKPAVPGCRYNSKCDGGVSQHADAYESSIAARPCNQHPRVYGRSKSSHHMAHRQCVMKHNNQGMPKKAPFSPAVSAKCNHCY